MNSLSNRYFKIFLLLFFACNVAYSQVTITNKGIDITVRDTTNKVYVFGSYVNENSGSIANGGLLFIKQDLTNNATNTLFSTEAGKVIFDSDAPIQNINGTKPIRFFEVDVNKPLGEITLGIGINISKSISFFKGNIFLNNFTVNLDSAGSLVNEKSTSRIYGANGFVSATRTITNFAIGDNIAGIGIHFSGNIESLGSTIFRRYHSRIPNITNGSILRHYDISPSTKALPWQIKLDYFDEELNGTNEVELAVFASKDAGAAWEKRKGRNDAFSNWVLTEEYTEIVTGNLSRIAAASQNCKDKPSPSKLPKSSEKEPFEVCFGKEAFLEATASGNRTVRYEWSHSFQRIAANTVNRLKVFTDSAGLSKYEVRIIDTQNACDSVATIWVRVLPLPKIEFLVNDICSTEKIIFKNSTTLSFGEIKEYQWSYNGTIFSKEKEPIYNFEKAGWYKLKLKVITNFGCADSLVKTIPVYPKPKVAYDFETACEQGQVRFTQKTTIAKPDSMEVSVRYLWDFGDGATSSLESPSHTYTQAGNYKVKLLVISNQGCKDSLLRDVTVFALPNANFSVQNFCAESDVAFTDATTVSNGQVASYEWEFGDGSTSFGKNPIKRYAKGGNYTVKLTVTTATGCKGTVSKQIRIFDLPKVDFGGKQITCSSSLMLDAQNGGSTYKWSNGSTEKTLTVTQNGIYSVEITSQAGCTYKETVEVVVNSTEKFTLGKDKTVCDNFELDAGIWKAVRWSTGSTNRKIQVLASGSYSVEVTDQGNCSQTASIQITVVPTLKPNMGADKGICPNESIVLEPKVEAASYVWSDGSVGRTLSITRAGLYWVKVKNTAGCETADTIIIRNKPIPTLSLGSDRQICENEQEVLDAGLPNFPNASYQWTSTSGFTANTPRVAVNQAATYTVKVSSSTDEFCPVEATLRLLPTEKITARYLAASSISEGDTVKFINLTVPKALTNSWDFADGNRSTEESPMHIFKKDGLFPVALKVTGIACRDTLTKIITVKKIDGGRLEDKNNANTKNSLFEGILSVKAYPNPTENFINLELVMVKERAIYLAIYDLSGRLLLTEEVKETQKYTTQYNLNGFAQGMYILRIVVGGETIAIKVIKY